MAEPTIPDDAVYAAAQVLARKVGYLPEGVESDARDILAAALPLLLPPTDTARIEQLRKQTGPSPEPERWPTDAEWREWYLALPEDRQLREARRVIEDGQIAWEQQTRPAVVPQTISDEQELAVTISNQSADLLYEAWVVIANGPWGDPATDDWTRAAIRWRDRWHATLDGAAAVSVEETPNG